MPGIARGTIDFASTHELSETHLAPAMTTYVGAGGCTVFVNGFPAIKQMDQALCGDIAIQASTKVFIQGMGAHRLNDSLDSHAGTYTPSVCAQASSDVFAG